ncbi:MAG: alpha/beta hydrolase [Betaproteobacteria bacterium]|nr:alpha/beta hydrolase [Betaproteobacteria bacterium]
MSAVPSCLRMDSTGCGLPLVLLHGIGGRASGWAPIQQACAQAGHTSLAWDMPGYGQSPPIEPCNFDALADALAALLDAQGMAQAVLVGHSLGGMVALQMWARHPERVAALVLAASSPAFGHGSGDFQQAFIAQRLAPLEAGRSMAEVATGLIPTMVAPGYSGPGLAQAQACMGSISPAAYKAALGALVQFEQRASLPTITVPTLCIAGEHDRTATPSVVQRMADKIPNAHFLCLPGVGHLLTFEQPDSFANALLPFLRSFQ